jgi:hypothetical protein
MGQPAQQNTINYVEIFTTSIPQARHFYGKAFGWTFHDWGPDYIGFDRDVAGIDGGFRTGDLDHRPGDGAPLLVIYSRDLEATQDAIVSAGGTIVVSIFKFPGGRRFHFSDGCGNVMAVWSE